MKATLSKITFTAGTLLVLVFTLSCSDSNDSGGGNPPAQSELCGGREYDPDVYRCERGELIGSCRGEVYYVAYERCEGGVIVELPPSSSSEGQYCYGYSTYRDCNLVGGRWITDGQHCLSGGGFLVNIDYCNKNGIGIDDTPSDDGLNLW